MSFDLDTLYSLLPAVYRIRDIEQLSGDTSLLGSGSDQAVNMNKPALPLLALMKVLAEQIGVLEENLAQLYDDQFVETCAEWALPYIGDLVGYQLPHDTSSQSLRGDVANTIRYRKGKGTVLLLEQLVRDVTGWDAHIVEFFQLLAVTQHMQRIRPENHVIDVRQILSPADVYPPSPFEKLAHTIDVRNIAAGQGRYNLPNIGIFIWRLKAYRLSNAPVMQAPMNDRNRYLYFLNPLGTDLQLFTHPQIAEEPTQLAGPLAVAAPISRAMMARAFSDYYGPDKSLWLTVTDTISGKEVDKPLLPDPLAELVEISDALHAGLTSGPLDFPKLAQVSTNLYTGLTTLQNIPYQQLAELIDKSETLSQALASVENLDFQTLADLINKSQTVSDDLKTLKEKSDENFSTFTICDLSDEPGRGAWRASPEDTIAIDPILGRLAFPRRRQGQRKLIPQPNNLRATFYYGFSADMGGGEYYRGASFTQGLSALQQVASQLTTCQQALDTLASGGSDGVVEITDSGRMEGILTINALANQRIELRGADFKRPLLVLANKKERPALVITGEEGADVTINGLVISGGPLHIQGNLRRVAIRHCTLVPAQESHKDRSYPGIICESMDTIVEIDHSIVGRVEVKGSVRVRITNSIVDATRTDGLAYSGPSALESEEAHLDTLSIENSTIIGRVHTTILELASNTIFYACSDEEDVAPIYVERCQMGCMRFSYLPTGSRVPLRRYHCQPEKDGDTLELHFTSLHYGNAGYAQLSQRTSTAILQGADDNAEMGAFHDLFQPQRATNLRLRLQEYLRFGFETGIIYST